MKLEQPINILVQRRAAIGDVIMSTGVVRELKKRYGADANIDVATDFAEVYRNNPHVRNIFPVAQIPNVNNRYELYINLDNAYELNPTEHYVKNYFYRAFGEVYMNRSAELFPTAEDKVLVDQDLKEIGNKFIVVHMRNWHWPAKNITMDVWLDVFTKVFTERTDFKVVCVGGTTDFTVEDHPLFYDLRGKYNNQQLKYLCDHAECFVGIDSGPFHCAAASDTHIIGLFTHLRPECIMPQRHLDDEWSWTAIQTQEDCRGCNDNQIRPVSQLNCIKKDFRCASNFDTDAIAQAILKQLGN